MNYHIHTHIVGTRTAFGAGTFLRVIKKLVKLYITLSYLLFIDIEYKIKRVFVSRTRIMHIHFFLLLLLFCASNAVKAISRGCAFTRTHSKFTNCKTTTLDYFWMFFSSSLIHVVVFVGFHVELSMLQRCSFLSCHSIKNGVRVMITYCWLGPLNRQCFVYFWTISLAGSLSLSFLLSHSVSLSVLLFRSSCKNRHWI